MNEDLYATLFEETDVSDVKGWDAENHHFNIRVMRLTGNSENGGVTESGQGFFRVTLNNAQTNEAYNIGDFATLEDAQAAIADIQSETYTIQKCLNDRGRYCYTMWAALVDIAIKGALDMADYNPGEETMKLREIGAGFGKAVEHEECGDLSAAALRGAAGFFQYLTTPGEPA